MKFFKTIDEKFSEIGFSKIKENSYGASYVRDNNEHKYIQRLDLSHKASGKHLVHSYVYSGNFDKVVGLTMYEMKLCISKMKQMGWRIEK